VFRIAASTLGWCSNVLRDGFGRPQLPVIQQSQVLLISGLFLPRSPSFPLALRIPVFLGRAIFCPSEYQRSRSIGECRTISLQQVIFTDSVTAPACVPSAESIGSAPWQAKCSFQVYQLDDQMKAKEFLNKNVKITWDLDSSNGMIHISSIEPV